MFHIRTPIVRLLAAAVLSGMVAPAVLAESGPEIQPPAPAREAGLTHLAFHEEFDSVAGIDMADTRNPGFNFYIVKPFSNVTTPTEGIRVRDGVLHLRELKPKGIKNLQLSSVAGRHEDGSPIGFAPEMSKARAYYFEIAIAFDPARLDKDPGTVGFPAFWTMSIEHLFPPRDPKPYYFFENDFIEYNPRWFDRENQFMHALHHWRMDASGHSSDLYPGSHAERTIEVPAGVEWNRFNRVATLWTANESIKTYFNEDLRRTVLYQDHPALKVADGQRFPVLIGSGEWPIRVDYVRVWTRPDR